MSVILNLTQHPATPEQVAAGVLDLTGESREQLIDLLTFAGAETRENIWARAEAIAYIATSWLEPEDRADDDGSLSEHDPGGPAWSAMIGGAGWLMGPLESSLINAGINPVYAFSRRESVEQVQADGSVRKVNVFRHTEFQAGALHQGFGT